MKTPESRPRRFESQLRFLQARLSPEGYLGLHLTIGLLVLVAAGWWFSEIAEDVSRDTATRLLDDSITAWFHACDRAADQDFPNRDFSWFGRFPNVRVDRSRANPGAAEILLSAPRRRGRRQDASS